MKLSREQADVLARVFERYIYDTERHITNNFRFHVEHPKNKNLLVELVQDMTLLVEIYPFVSGNRAIENSIEERLSKYQSKEELTKIVENNLPPTEEDIYGLLPNIDNDKGT
jgi:hypothetical protein